MVVAIRVLTVVAALVAAALWVVFGVSSASAMTAGELLGQCEQLERNWVTRGSDVQIDMSDASITFEAGQCWGFLNAYFELAYVKLFNTEKPTAPATNPLHACPPNGALSNTQLIRMFLHEARNNPSELNQGAFFVISNMLVRNYPCH
jgi:hypothetical protein